MNALLDRLLAHPGIYTLAAKIVTANYRGAKRLLRSELPDAPYRTVLDLGCGTAILAPLFHEKFYVGIETDTRYLVFARRRNPGRSFLRMNAEQMGFRSSSLDLVSVVGVFHHLPDQGLRSVAAELRRTCRPEGKVIAVELVPPGPRNVLERVRQRVAERGSFIRPIRRYCDLVAPYMNVEKAYRARSGFLEYAVMVLRPRDLQDGGSAARGQEPGAAD